MSAAETKAAHLCTRHTKGKGKVFPFFFAIAIHLVNSRGLKKLIIAPLMHFLLHILCSIIVTTVQYLSPALHKNFTDADFDFKVCDFD